MKEGITGILYYGIRNLLIKILLYGSVPKKQCGFDVLVWDSTTIDEVRIRINMISQFSSCTVEERNDELVVDDSSR